LDGTGIWKRYGGFWKSVTDTGERPGRLEYFFFVLSIMVSNRSHSQYFHGFAHRFPRSFFPLMQPVTLKSNLMVEQ
jgi:hypothetical protein